MAPEYVFRYHWSSTNRPLFPLQRRNRRRSMLVRFQTVQNRGNPAVRADHESRPLNPHIFLAVHALFFHHAVLVADGFVHIRQQGIRQVIFLFEFLLSRGLVGGNAQHHSSRPLDLGECVAEPARLNGSTWRVGLGIKKEHHILAAIVFQCGWLAFFIGKSELRGFIINFHGFPVFIRSMNLYSRSRFLASAVLVLVCVVAVTAAFAQRRKAHKLRATAVVEVTTDSAGIVGTHIFPVTILDEGSFHDASIYKATPEPMALDKGIVYEAQSDGIPVGYATVLSSANNKGWTALGKWQAADEPKKAQAQAPAPATPGDDRPIIHRGDASPSPTPASTPAPGTSDSTTSSPSASASSSDSSSSAAEDADRPVLRRRSPSPQPEAASTPQPSPPPSTQAPAEGTPAPRVKLPVITSGAKTFVAVSDNESTDIRSFAFKWKPGEEQQMESKMRKLALAQLPQENAQLNTNSLQNVVMRSFDLDLSNDAVVVFSAEIPGSYLAAGGKGTPGKFISRYVTVIARVDFEGVPQKLASSVTDSSRLDVAPRLELIDAVDVDGDGLAELLFREYGFDDKSFIIYGVGRSTVTKVFEGASMPLR